MSSNISTAIDGLSESKSEIIISQKEEIKDTIISTILDTSLNDDSKLPYALRKHTHHNRSQYTLIQALDTHYKMNSIHMRRHFRQLNFHISSPEIELYEIVRFMNSLSRSDSYETAIYILALENSKYYVGIADTSYIKSEYTDSNKYEIAVKTRLNSHRDNGGGSSPTNWTWIHPVISLCTFIQGDREDENLITLLVSKCVGEDNVRGGNWTGIHSRPSFPKMTVEEIMTAIIKNSK